MAFNPNSQFIQQNSHDTFYHQKLQCNMDILTLLYYIYLVQMT